MRQSVVSRLALVAATAACHASTSAPDDASADATEHTIDVCDAFTGADTNCPAVSPLRCFAMCEAGGCYCEESAKGPRWVCVTDLSCEPDCAPIDDACGTSAASTSE